MSIRVYNVDQSHQHPHQNNEIYDDHHKTFQISTPKFVMRRPISTYFQMYKCDPCYVSLRTSTIFVI